MYTVANIHSLGAPRIKIKIQQVIHASTCFAKILCTGEAFPKAENTKSPNETRLEQSRLIYIFNTFLNLNISGLQIFANGKLRCLSSVNFCVIKLKFQGVRT